LSLFDIVSNEIHLAKPSLISLVVISVFISVSICIARVEYEKYTI